jgi:transcriptional regulator with XRE-family HTH domain
MGTKVRRNPGLYARPTYVDLLARLAANTRRLREAKGWTQAEAAEHCEMATYVLQTVEGGRANFTGTVVARLCDGFEVDVRELFVPAAPLAKRPRGRPPKGPSSDASPEPQRDGTTPTDTTGGKT